MPQYTNPNLMCGLNVFSNLCLLFQIIIFSGHCSRTTSNYLSNLNIDPLEIQQPKVERETFWGRHTAHRQLLWYLNNLNIDPLEIQHPMRHPWRRLATGWALLCSQIRVELYSPKEPANVKITALYRCAESLFRAATLHKDRCCDL